MYLKNLTTSYLGHLLYMNGTALIVVAAAVAVAGVVPAVLVVVVVVVFDPLQANLVAEKGEGEQVLSRCCGWLQPG